MSEIIWTGSPEDQTARINDYVLRAAKGEADFWWWCVAFRDTEFAYTETKRIFTIEEAKTACEKAYREHLKTR